ncbi:hypothetical protein SAMN02745165_00519 [Malonomonas rubra DSM 5091]|uniref:Doubled CXXCH motif domain-containing protein n=1 Tax=Malonomonas rubra DSM 5091 TaxID=1122189 RepID=A0A1M6CGN5_MALRU|nr:cytochrome c3 family protein [Malonomonas rubra]SHI60011.1 hypothetical protein SAMN02745165_00519 [Malonomonas rubra DSM 5091]
MAVTAFPRNARMAGILFLLTAIGLLITLSQAKATINGSCVDCHTMHNSQNGASMNFDDSATPNAALLKGSCLGCHAQGSTSALVDTGSDMIPQVMHSEATDLAGGNFGFITGMKGSGADDNKGHNIAALTGEDGTVSALPGGIQQSFHEDQIVNTSNLTCAGTNGCHGYRYAGDSFPEGITGAHHNNVDGKLTTADTIGNSYRFLTGIVGLEDDDWQYTRASNDHNEYFAMAEPIKLGCSGGTTSCHATGGVKAPDGTISQYCATCHGNFHTIETTASTGIGSVASSPFIRHPTDIILPADGEYALYTAYNLDAPVARTTAVPDVASASVTPGSDAVVCMSCHMAHASDYPDMLRWDYLNDCSANQVNTDCGCFACHTAKDGDPSE